MELRERTADFLELILTNMVGSGVTFAGSSTPGNSRYDYFHGTILSVLGAFNREMDSVLPKRKGFEIWGGRQSQWKKILDTWDLVKDDPGLSGEQLAVLDTAVFAIRCA